MSERPSAAAAAGEAAIVAVAGAALAWPVGSVLGIEAFTTTVAAINGALAGWRGVYAWRTPTGWIAFVLDSTWSLAMTAAGLFANGIARLQRDAGYVDDLSRRSNRQVYRRGFMPRRGYAITLGNTICGAADVDRARRRRLITDHEDVHVWQARWFGPLYPVLYLGWMVAAGGAGVVVWLLKSPRGGLAKTVETMSYHVNPFEWWAYSRDDYWPPKGKLAGLGWRRPIVQPLSALRAEKARRRAEIAARRAGRV